MFCADRTAASSPSGAAAGRKRKAEEQNAAQPRLTAFFGSTSNDVTDEGRDRASTNNVDSLSSSNTITTTSSEGFAGLRKRKRNKAEHVKVEVDVVTKRIKAEEVEVEKEDRVEDQTKQQDEEPGDCQLVTDGEQNGQLERVPVRNQVALLVGRPSARYS